MISKAPGFNLRCSLLVSMLMTGACMLLAIPHAAAVQQIFQTQQAVIYYDNAADLLEMDRRLHFSQVKNFYQGYFYSQNPGQAVLSPGLAAKVDGLFTKVCLMLSRWPKNNHMLRIFLLKDGRQVRQRHLVLQPSKPGLSFFGYDPLEGFYEPTTRTIFLSLEGLHEGILAHEMTHFVLCETAAIPPPASVQEDWARHVESRLD
jgi:hypothetical protein